MANVDAHVSVPAVTVTGPGRMVIVMGTSSCHLLNGERDEIVENIHWRVALLPFVASCGDNGVLERTPS